MRAMLFIAGWSPHTCRANRDSSTPSILLVVSGKLAGEYPNTSTADFQDEKNTMPSTTRRTIEDRQTASGLGDCTKRGFPRSVLLLVWCVSLCLPGCSGCGVSPKETPQAESPEPNKQHSDDSAKAPSEGNPARETRDNSSAPTETESPAGDSVPEATKASLPAESSAPASSSDSTDSPSTLRKTGDPDSALNVAMSLREKARRAANRKDYGGAFDHTSRAWEAAKAWPKDARLKKLAEELVADLEKLGDQANSKFSNRAGDSSTKLIDK